MVTKARPIDLCEVTERYVCGLCFGDYWACGLTVGIKMLC